MFASKMLRFTYLVLYLEDSARFNLPSTEVTPIMFQIRISTEFK